MNKKTIQIPCKYWPLEQREEGISLQAHEYQWLALSFWVKEDPNAYKEV